MNPFDEGGMIDKLFRAALPEVFSRSIVDDLSLRNRAYQVLYALGDESPATLYPGEAAVLVGIVRQLHQEPVTMLDRILLSKMSHGMIAYVAGSVPIEAFHAINGKGAPTPKEVV